MEPPRGVAPPAAAAASPASAAAAAARTGDVASCRIAYVALEPSTMEARSDGAGEAERLRARLAGSARRSAAPRVLSTLGARRASPAP